MAKKAAKAAPKAAKPPKITASSKLRKKSELYTILAEHNGLSRKQVSGIFDTLAAVMAADLAKPSADKPKIFVVPGLMKVQSVYKPATKATEKPNPFKPGEMMTVKAKPASTKIRVRPLKALKAMV